MSYTVKLIAGFIGTALLATFVIGLSHSISTGFAGFWGGFPFMIITIIVLAMAIYDFWDECIRRKDQ
jgi:sterol desaturase/sphingolipid hydroxylase (fatty acid hydroxylase superfamily)